MITKNTVLLISALIFVGVASAQPVTIEPSSFEFNITSGDSYIQEFTIRWDGDREADIRLNVTSYEGVNTSFQSSEYSLSPGESRETFILFSTDLALEGGQYPFNIGAVAETRTGTRGGSPSGSPIENWRGDDGQEENETVGESPVNDTDQVDEPDVEDPGDEQNETDIEGNTTGNLTDNPRTSPDEAFWRSLLLSLALLFILILFAVFIYILYRGSVDGEDDGVRGVDRDRGYPRPGGPQ